MKLACLTSPLEIFQSNWGRQPLDPSSNNKRNHRHLWCRTGRYFFDEETNAAYEILEVMTQSCALYTTEFKSIVNVHLETTSEDVAYSVGLLLTDTPNHTQRITQLINSNHDRLIKHIMASVADICEQSPTKGGRGLIFCRFMKFPDWSKNLCAMGENEELENDVDPEITKTVQIRVLTFEQKPLKFIRAKRTYKSNPMTVKIFHNICEICVHLWLNGLTSGDKLPSLDYRRGD